MTAPKKKPVTIILPFEQRLIARKTMLEELIQLFDIEKAVLQHEWEEYQQVMDERLIAGLRQELDNITLIGESLQKRLDENLGLLALFQVGRKTREPRKKGRTNNGEEKSGA